MNIDYPLLTIDVGALERIKSGMLNGLVRGKPAKIQRDDAGRNG